MPIVENLQNISRDGMVASCYQNCVYTYLTATVQIFQKSLDCIYFQSENFQLESRIIFFLTRFMYLITSSCIFLQNKQEHYRSNDNCNIELSVKTETIKNEGYQLFCFTLFVCIFAVLIFRTNSVDDRCRVLSWYSRRSGHPFPG